LRLALFGGTFDPIHSAHVTAARAAADRFALDRVLFVPAANPPHKDTSHGATYEDRFRMVELACKSDPRFEASRLEEGSAKSYSILTIEKVLAPDRQVFFIIGSDAFADIRTWYRWQEVIRSVDFIVVTRPGHKHEPPPGSRVHVLGDIALPVSSSEIRHELAAGHIPADLPKPVADYIAAHHLYGYLPTPDA
jgi:nicotinate-nucleotide adenylyltransferase